MRRVVTWAVNNTPSMNTVMVAIVVLGLGAGMLLRRESFPEFTLDTVIVSVLYPGATPTEVEQGICQKVEEAVRAVDGIKKITSIANEGNGNILITLESYVDDPQRAVNDIRSAVDRIPSFPELAEEPEIRAIVARSPAIQVAVVGPDSTTPQAEWRLRELAELVRDEILLLPSVSQATLLAARPYQIDIEIPEENLRKYGLTLADVAARLRRENVEIPAGSIKTDKTEYLLRGNNRRTRGTELSQLPVIKQADGVVLTVGDLGQVVDGFEDLDMASYVNGRPALSIQVDKTAAEDLLEIVEQVRGYVAEKTLPPDYELVIWLDTSQEVRGRLDLLTRSGLIGLVLVFIILSLFLNIRLAFWVALGIPVSVLGTCAVMYGQGQTLNMLTMFSFVMALGIVVDDAIVIGENIFTHRQRGKNKIQAAIDGTVEVAPSVVASVMTTVIAFMPMFFVSGLMGRFIAVMPLAMISMLLLSLFESIFILPCHLAHTRFRTKRGIYRTIRATVDRTIDGFIQRVYAPTLRWLLSHPEVAFAGSISVLLLTLGIIAGGFTPFVLAPQVDGDFIACDLVFPAGTPSATTQAASAHVEQSIRDLGKELAEDGLPVLSLTYRSVGFSISRDPTQAGRSGSNVATVWVELLPAADRPKVTSQEVIARWRERTGEIAGAERVVFEETQVGPGGKPIEFKLVGADLEELEEAVERTKNRLASYPGVFDVADGSEIGKWEVQLRVKSDAEAMGVQLADLASTVRAAYYGEEVMRLQRGRHEVKLMVRYPEHQRRSLAQFEEIRVRAPTGEEVPLSNLAERKLDRAYSQILRVNQRRAITITANIDEAVANAAEIRADLDRQFMPDLAQEFPGVSARWEGQQEETDESMGSLGKGFIVAVFAMYLLLTLEFRSYVQPMIILAVIPFGLVGAVLGHLAMGMPLTIFTMFGVVALSGVVANDSIVLVDFINRRIAEGAALHDALVDAGCGRFRPVLLTSVTTIAGLLPILMERSMQAQLLIPMAASISFGIGFATLWILLLVPSIYRTYFVWTTWLVRSPRVASTPADGDSGTGVAPLGSPTAG